MVFPVNDKGEIAIDTDGCRQKYAHQYKHNSVFLSLFRSFGSFHPLHLSFLLPILLLAISAFSTATFAQEPSTYSVGGFVFRVAGVGAPVGTPVDIVNANSGQNVSTVTINPRGAYLIGDLNGDEGDTVNVHAHNATHQGLRTFALPAASGTITEITDINFSFNQIPILSNPAFNDSLLAGNEDISFSIAFTDHDADDGILTFRWFVNGINVFNQTKQPAANGTTISSALKETNFSKGDKVNVSVTARDIFYTSEESRSSELVVLNSAPLVSAIALNDTAPRTNEDIKAATTFTDIDADSGNVTFQWFVNNSNVFNQTLFSVANGTSAQSNFSSGFFSKSDRINVSVFAGDGESFSQITSSAVITAINTAPSASGASIQPSFPLTDDALQAVYSFFDIDGDNEKGSNITWFKNGLRQTGLQNLTTVSAGLTSKGEKWSFSVSPGDGGELGGILASANVTIGNAQPSVSALSINNTSPKTNDDISASLAYSDPDGDVGNVTFQWFVNSSNVFNQTLRNVANGASARSNFSSGFFGKSDKINVSAFAKDGETISPTASSATITAANTVPSLANPAFNNTAPKTNEDILGIAAYSDADGDKGNVTFRWYVNGTLAFTDSTAGISNGTNATRALLSNLFSKSDRINFTASASDGTDSGALLASAIINVANTAPSASSLSISPSSPTSEDNLTSSYSYFDIDGDPQRNSEINWSRNGVVQAALSNKTSVNTSLTAKGEKWGFSVRPGDGDKFGSVQISGNATIGNALPAASNAAIVPQRPFTLDNLTATYTFFDTDNDVESGSRIIWLKNGAAQSALENKSKVDASFTKLGENWSFKITPRDGFGFGNELQSSNITILNTPPSLENMTLNNTSPKTFEDIFANVAYLDPDGRDEIPLADDVADNDIQFRWLVNGQNVFNDSVRKIASHFVSDGTAIISNFSSSFYAKGDKVNVTAIATDGENISMPLSSQAIVVGNTPPAASSLEISPSTPDTLDELFANFSFFDADGDGQDGSEIVWLKNGVEQILLRNKTIVNHTLTAKGDFWSFSVRPKDGTDFGILQQSANATILNAAPLVGQISLNNTAPKTNDDISASLAYSDPDGDMGNVTFRWFVNSSNVFNQTLRNVADGASARSNFSSGFFAKSDKINVSAFAKDGEAISPAASSATITVANTAPSLANPAFNNTAPKTNENILGGAAYADADGDKGNVTFRWYVNGTLAFTESTAGISNGTNATRTLLSSLFNKSDRINFTASASDGSETGNLIASAIITAANTAPSASSLSISPANPTSEDNLTLSYSYFDIDGDQQRNSAFNWTKNGIAQASLSDKTIVNASLTSKGEIWTFTVMPSDGTDYGIIRQSAEVTIGNSIPSISAITINNTSPKTNDDISASITYTDPDGDAGNVTFQWFINGTNALNQTARNVANVVNAKSNLSSGLFGKSDRINVSAVGRDGESISIEALSSILIVSNTAPSASNPAILPPFPSTEDNLLATYGFTDDDGDTEKKSLIKWFKNGAEQSALENLTTTSGALTSKGERWSFSVRPGDGDELGSVQASANVTIGNSLPSLSALTLNNTAPKTNEDIKASTAYRDPDSDNGNVTFRWSVNQVIVKTEIIADAADGQDASSNLSSGLFNKGDIVNVSAQPNDGLSDGNLTSLEIAVQNAKPLALNLSILPPNPFTNDTLLANYTFTDEDGDNESGTLITWFRNKSELEFFIPSFSVPPDRTAKGDIISFRLTPKDGTELGNAADSAEITILNAPPRALAPSITPQNPTTDDNLSANYLFSDEDGDAESRSEITWLRNGVEVPGIKNKTIVNASLTTKGDVWSYLVRPSDSTASGEEASSENITIANAFPQLTAPTFNDSSVRAGEDVAGSTNYSDPDGDAGNVIFSWFVNDNLHLLERVSVSGNSAVASPILSGALLAKGNTVNLTVQADDGVNASNLFSSSFIVLNTLPNASNLSIIPAQPKTDDNLSAAFAFSDIDGDNEGDSSIQWFKNGEEQAAEENKRAIPANLTAKGERWSFAIRPSDGESFGDIQRSENTTISNTLPEALNAMILPQSPVFNDSLGANYSFFDADGDNETATRIRWFKDGVEQNLLENATLVGEADTEVGETWFYLVTVGDGEGFGQETKSANASIQTIPPQASEMACDFGAGFASCNSTEFGDTIKAVAINCTDIDETISRVSYRLENIFDNSLLLNEPNATARYGDRYVLNTSILIQDSGGFFLEAECFDTFGMRDSINGSWDLPFGNVTPYLITGNLRVVRNKSFSFSSGTGCSGGECTDIISILDPLGVETFSLELGAGWNLISLPLIPADKRITKVLESIEGKYDVVEGFEADGAKIFDPYLDDFNDLETMEPNVGYWIKMSEPAALTVTGRRPLEGDFDLGEGWNLISVPMGLKSNDLSQDAFTIEPKAAVKTIYRYNARSRKYEGALHDNDYGWGSAEQFNSLEPGRGYWIKASEPATLNFFLAQAENSKGVIPMNEGSPFFTTSQNPISGGCLARILPGETCNQTWEVVPTGDWGTAWEFFTNYSTSINVSTGKANVVINTPPNATAVRIIPSSPTSSDQLTATFLFTDEDGDSPSDSRIRWFRNNAEQPQLENDTSVPSNMIFKRDNWTFSVIPSDGIEEGEERFSAEVTISNSPPGASKVSVSPAKPFTTDSLKAVYTYSDDDLDPQGKSEIKWYKNSVEQSSLRNRTAIASSFTAKNQYWHFTIRPYDGTNLGAILTSARVKIQNTAPVAKSVVVKPSNPKTGTTLTASYSFSDADNDKEKTSLIKWYKNGKYQSSLKNKKTVSGSLVKKGDKWYFTVQPYDGTTYGTLKKASQVTVK